MTMSEFINYFQYNAVVTLSTFFISLFVLVLHYTTKGKSTSRWFSTQRASLLKPRTYIRLFTHALGHSDWGHFSRNFSTILLLGPLIEEKYGSINLLIMFLITAFLAGVVNFIIGKSNMKGASCLTYMLIVLSAFANFDGTKIPLTLVLIILFYIVNEIIDFRKKDNIAHYSHLIGALCGVVFGIICINSDLIEFFIK